MCWLSVALARELGYSMLRGVRVVLCRLNGVGSCSALPSYAVGRYDTRPIYVSPIKSIHYATTLPGVNNSCIEILVTY